VFVSTAMIVLYTGAGNIADGTVEGVFEWASCSLKSFLKNKNLINVISYVLISYEEGNLLKYNVSEWSI